MSENPAIPSQEPETSRRSLRAYAYENPRPEVQALVPKDARRILDLGCASGALGAALKARQAAEVIGIEVDPAYVADATTRLDQVIEGDVEEVLAAPSAAELGQFDCLIAADVLEHLRDPWTALQQAVALLAAGGKAVVSLPNVRYWETFWQLGLRGTWPRREIGIFDRTHLQWFTLRDTYGLLGKAGLEVDRVQPQFRLRPSDDRGATVARALRRTPLRPFFAFQYVLGARKL